MDDPTDYLLFDTRNYSAIEGHDDTWGVQDGRGGVWWPSPQAARALAASDDVPAATVAMCINSPMRGRWRA